MNLHRVFVAFFALMAGDALGADPLEPVLLAQRSPPGTALAIDGDSAGDTVYLRASSDPATCAASSAYVLEVEVRPIDTPFSGIPTHTSAVIAKPSCVTTEYPLTAIGGLVPGAYKWQARESVDGVRSRWVSFNGGLTAFRVPEIALSESTLDFGDVRTATSSSGRAIEIINLGTRAATLSGAVGSGPFRITEGPALPLILDPGRRARFVLAAAPLSAGTQRGTFTVASTESSASLRAELMVNGTEPRLLLDAASVAFGQTTVGETPSARTVTVRNGGTATLTISGGAIAGPFAFAGLSGAIAPGAAQSFTLAYAPTSSGSHASTLSIASDDPAGPAELTITGSAIEPAPQPNQPSLFISPAARDFGAATVRTSRVLTLGLANAGGAPLNITALSIEGRDAAEFAIDSPPAPWAIAPGTSAELAIRFTPIAVGLREATLRIQSDKYPAGAVAIALSGWGHGPKLALSSVSLDFGAASLGRTAVRTLEILNEGSAAATVSALSLEGMAASDFSSAESVPFTVTPGEVRTVSVAFQAAAAGPRTATLTLISDDPLIPERDVALAGTGLSPAALFSPCAAEFGSTRIGQAVVQVVSLRNAGDGPLTVTSVSVTGRDAVAFKVSGVNLPVFLAPGAAPISAEVSFQPTAIGQASAQLVFGSADLDASTLQVPLLGEGVAPALSISTSAIDFGGQVVGHPSSPRQVVISNRGTSPLYVSSLAMAGVFAGSFILTAPAAPFSLAVGESKAISVIAEPRLVGDLSARLVLTTDAPSAPTVQVNLHTQGISRALAVTPTAIDFGAIKAGTTPEPVVVTFRNLSSEALSLAPAAVNGASATAFSAELSATLVPPSGSVTALVHYRPTAAGAHTATLLLTSADEQMTAAAVQLAGIATSSVLDVSPSSFEFPPAIVGTTVEQVFTITNKTSAPVTVMTLGDGDPEFAPRAAAPLTIEGGRTAALTVIFTPHDEGTALGTVALAVLGSGGELPEIAIPLSGTGSVAAPARSGCSTAGGASAAWTWLAAIAALWLRRRRS